ncbi:netrin receptor UNC5B-like [Strongylocentrotus purpuratus]|uniref:Death domain-containing protein n=1 Tax=Strongylocentrotus purpuratus TaxID=7668 RepID=A0A7M7PDF9_STRPU|nr:netrin receptor UNC5B-like [Strongylocentrotus purpuratus]
MDFVTETLDSLIQHWARRIKYDVCFLCPRCSRKKRLKDCFKRMSLQCGLHSIPTAAIKFKFGMSEEGVESGNESPISTSSTLPTEGSIAHLVTSDIGIQPLTGAQVASEVERILPRINDLPAVPSSSVSIHGNVFNMYVTGRHDLVPPHPMIIPLAIRQELSKLLNGPRVTHDDWTGLASALRLDDYIASLTNKPDPTADLIDLAERQNKICSLEDLRQILKQMKRDDCVDVFDAGASVESNNRLMIKDRDRSSSSSDDSY